MRCKQGDSAHIIDGALNRANVGKLVKCLRYDGDHSVLGPIWFVQSEGSDLVTEWGSVGSTCHVPDAWLRPLPPDAPPAENDPVYALVDGVTA